MSERVCPTPAKSRFATEVAALKSSSRYGKTLRPYECECGWWHLTSKPAAPVPVDSPVVTGRVLALSDAEFAALVSAEVRGLASAEQAGALRSAAVADRWLAALKIMQRDLSAQFAQRKGDRSAEAVAWRPRALLVQTRVQERMREAQRVRAAAREAVAAERARLRESGLAPRAARGLAGERAKQRLIAAHREEFDALLVEEFQAAGLALPVRMVQHMLRRGAGEAA